MSLLAPLSGPLYSQASHPTFLMDATSEMVAFEVVPHGTTPIAKVQFYLVAETGTPGLCGVIITDDNVRKPNILVGVPVDAGGVSVTLKTFAATDVAVGLNTLTFTNAFTPTEGTRYWVVFYAISGTWDASNRYQFLLGAIGLLSPLGENYATSVDGAGATWTLVGAHLVSCSVLDASDNYLPSVASACLASTTAAISYSDASNPDEYGSVVVIPANAGVKLYGLDYLYRLSDAATSDHTMVAYTDPFGTPALVDDLAIDVSAFNPTISLNASERHRFLDGPHTIAAGSTLLVGAKATAAGTLTLKQAIFASQACRESALCVRDMYGATRNGGSGAFSAQVDRVYSFGPWLSLEAGASGGAPGHANMRGGLL